MRALGAGVLPILLAVTAAAHADPLPEPVWVESITASSVYKHSKDYAPTLLLEPKTTWIDKTNDLRIDSAWCEGKPDAGLGESVTIKLARPTVLPKIAIRPGVQMTQALFDANNRITGLALTTDDGRTIHAKPSGKREALAIELGGKPITTLTIAIESVAPGKMNDSCLSQIDLTEDVSVATGFPAAAAARYQAEAGAIVALVTAADRACDAKQLAAVADFPFAWTDRENTHSSIEAKRFILHKHSFATAAAFAKACKDGTFLGDAGGVEAVTGSGVGKLALVLTRAEASADMVLSFQNGHWHLVTLE